MQFYLVMGNKKKKFEGESRSLVINKIIDIYKKTGEDFILKMKIKNKFKTIFDQNDLI